MKKLLMCLMLTANVYADEDIVYESGMNALGGAAVAFVGSGYVGSIYGGLGQMLNYAIFEHGKTATTNVYLTVDSDIKIAYRVDEYRIKNPYNNQNVWVGTYKKDGDTYRDTEGRLIVIKDKAQ